jgi:sugar fermentation stimulation protein A
MSSEEFRVTPPKGGAYLLFLEVKQQVTVEVGGLGRLDFIPGIYAYTGSAMNGLEARVGRHLRGDGKLHWHIDHLRRHAKPMGALLIPSEMKQECAVNALLDRWTGSEPYAPGFGCSDCSCDTHLHRLEGGALSSLRSHFGPGAWLAPFPDRTRRLKGF